MSFNAGKFAGMNPEKWKIVDGKLFLGWTRAETAAFIKTIQKAQ